MHTENLVKLKYFKNLYCDVLSCGLGEFMDETCEQDLIRKLTIDQLEKITEYVAIKNKLAGVGQVMFKMPYPRIASKMIEKYGLNGKEILSAKVVNNLTIDDFVGDKIIVEIEDINDYSDGQLSDISQFCATTDTEVLINFGQSLEEVGKSVNRFGMSPASALESFGFLDRKCYLKGLNFIDKDDQNLILQYGAQLIFTPRQDGEEGTGAINMYNFVFHGHKFGFGSGKCYNIDMLKEGKVAVINTNNLMHGKVAHVEQILKALQSEEGSFELSIANDYRRDALLEQKIEIQDESLIKRHIELRENMKQIAKELKEKLHGN